MKIYPSYLPLLLYFISVHAFAPRPVASRPRATGLFFKDATDPTTIERDATLPMPEVLPGEQTDKPPEQLKMEFLKKTRPYPLFIAEKVAGVVDGAVKGLFKRSSDEENNESAAKKEDIVVLGSGWGAASFLSEIDSDLYDVTVISPRNHFIFTPMLAGSSTGSVEYRSICEPIREINREAQYLEAFATDIDPKAQTVSYTPVTCDDDDEECEPVDELDVHYDRLVVTLGARTNTFGIPGVEEHTSFLKEIRDAKTIRTKIVNCFERASMPSLTGEERRELLTFAIIGAGPAGVEFAAELRDFIEQDGSKYYPCLLKFCKIKVIEATNTVLAPFEKSLQDEALQRMQRPFKLKDCSAQHLVPTDYELQEVLLDSPVSEVGKHTIYLKDGREIKYGGVAVWAGGNGPVPLTQQLIESLGEEQAKEQNVARGRIVVDRWMRALGGNGKVLAVGDCSCITEDQLPPTGQVAAQEGEYLADVMNKQYNLSTSEMDSGELIPPIRDPEREHSSLADSIASITTETREYAKPFQYLNLGILAYTGDCTALAQVTTVPNAAPFKSRANLATHCGAVSTLEASIMA